MDGNIRSLGGCWSPVLNQFYDGGQYLTFLSPGTMIHVIFSFYINVLHLIVLLYCEEQHIKIAQQYLSLEAQGVASAFCYIW